MSLLHTAVYCNHISDYSGRI